MGVVIYDLPGRDCAAKASNGELAVGELDRYKTEYIDGTSQSDCAACPSLLTCRSHRRDHLGLPQHGLRPRHRARLAAQPGDQHRPHHLPGLGRRVPRWHSLRPRAA